MLITGPVTALEVSSDGMLLCTISAQDRAIKVFDVINFGAILRSWDQVFLIFIGLPSDGSMLVQWLSDMIHQIELSFTPVAASWIHPHSSPKGILAV